MRLTYAILLSILASTSGFAPAFAQPAQTLPLSPAQVACNESQLGRLLGRMEIRRQGEAVLGFSSHMTLFVSEGDGGVLFRGTEVRNEIGPRAPSQTELVPHSDCLQTAERMMGYEISVQEQQFLLNPERAVLDQILMARIDSQTNLTSTGCLPAVLDDHELRLGLGDERNPFGSFLEINNVKLTPAGQDSEGGKPSSSGAGRALRGAGLADRCSDRTTPWDRRIFALLERILRPSSFTSENETVTWFDQEVALFRGSDPHVYRADVYKIGKDSTGRAIALSRLALEMSIGWDDSGRLTTGTVRVLPKCQAGELLGCSSEEGPAWVYLFRPLLPDNFLHDLTDAQVVGINFRDLPTEVPVDWAELLRFTAWNGPL